MNSSATILDIRPKVQQHEETATSIALALSALSEASEAACVAHGVELLSTYRDDPSCATRAATFSTLHKPKHPNIPHCFWDLFADLEAHAISAGNASFSALAAPREVATPRAKVKSKSAASLASPATGQSTELPQPDPSPVKSEASEASTSQFTIVRGRPLKRRKAL